MYLPGFFTIPPVDRDESRFAQASRQMFESVALAAGERDAELHSGGLAVPMVGGKERLNKPPLIYWVQAGSAAVLTGGQPREDAVWMYRVPSLVAGLVIVLGTWRLGISMWGPVRGGAVGWVGAALLAVSPVFVWEAHQARADMVMVAWTVLAMGCLWEVWRGARGRISGESLTGGTRGEEHGAAELTRGTRSTSSLGRFVAPWVLLWVFVALGVLTKGPITPMVVLLAGGWLSVFGRDWRWIRQTRPVLGLAIVGAAVGPWVWVVAEHVGFGRYWSIVYDEVFARAGSAKEGHWGPPGYHLVLLVVLFWPGSLLTGLAIGRAWRRGFGMRAGRGDGRRKRSPLAPGSGEGAKNVGGAAGGRMGITSLRSWLVGVGRSVWGARVTRTPEAFLIAWMVPSWIVFELVGTKLPHYTMPLYPAMALMTARGLFAWGALTEAQRRRAVFGGWLWAVVGAALFVVVGLGVVLSIEAPMGWLGILLMAFAAPVLGVVVIREVVRRDLLAAQAWSVLLALTLLISFLTSAAPAFFGMTKWAHERAAALAEGAPVTWVGLREDSLVWFGRGRPSYTEPEELVAWFEANPEGVAVVSVYAEDSFRSRPEELWAVEHVFGFHYAKGRLEKLALVKRMPE